MQGLVEWFSGLSAQSWANVIAFTGFVLALWSYNRQQNKDRKVERQENYLRLELESNAVFRFEAEHGDTLLEYKAQTRPSSWVPDAQRDGVADQFFLQQLNLFEIATRSRRRHAVEPQIFGSWVIWFEAVIHSWWFRQRWAEEYADNYTMDLYAIFTPSVAEYDEMLVETAAADPEEREAAEGRFRRRFFDHVAALMRCGEILKWLDRPAEMAMQSYRNRRHGV